MKTFLFEESVLRYNKRNCFLFYPDHYLIIPAFEYLLSMSKENQLFCLLVYMWYMYVTCVNALACAIYNPLPLDFLRT